MIDTRIKTLIILGVIVIGIYIVINLPKDNKNIEPLFPSVIGNGILQDNVTGIYFIKNMIGYDDFKGNLVQGYKATYSGRNGTMIIFIAQMPDNNSANKSLNEMALRLGYKPNLDFKEGIRNNETIVKLPVNNPEVFLVQKNRTTYWHYTFSKFDKVYWIGFNNSDVDYQVNMLIEVYRHVDKEG